MSNITFSRLRTSGLLALSAILTLLSLTAAEAQRLNATIAIGHSSTIWSEALQEQRRIFVSLPPFYERSGRHYPVLYLLDAEKQFRHAAGIVEFLAENDRIPQMILIGIANTRRARDLTPPSVDTKAPGPAPDVGGADVFLKFLADELVPWVDARYRTAPSFRILSGHSFGGLFNFHALLGRPESFQAHIAISPSLWWDDGAVVSRAKAQLGSIPAPHFLYVGWGDDEETISTPARELMSWLEKNPAKGVLAGSRHYAGEDHGTTPHRVLYDGLEAIFSNWRVRYSIDGELQDIGLDDLEAHCEALSKTYGFTVTPSAEAIDYVGRYLLEKRNDAAAALAVFQHNAKLFPYLPSTHESIGDALSALGRDGEALAAYHQAMVLAVEQESGYDDPVEQFRARKIRKAVVAAPASRKNE